MIGVTGKNSSITKEFLKLNGEEEVIYGTALDLPLTCDAYLLCAGVLHGKNSLEIGDSEALETFKVNFIDVIRFCDRLFTQNKKAKVCIIGSESAFKGSYDMVYAGSKVALHLYVETKQLLYPEQHIVCVSPTVIEDTGMTQRRDDLKDVLMRGKMRRQGRWLTAKEVAKVAHSALFESTLSNTVVRMR